MATPRRSSLLIAARRIAGGEEAASYGSSVLQRLLQALGVTEAEAASLALEAVADRHRST